MRGGLFVGKYPRETDRTDAAQAASRTEQIARGCFRQYQTRPRIARRITGKLTNSDEIREREGVPFNSEYRSIPVGVLRFSFGTMGSGKSTLALQIHHNLAKRSKRGLLLSQLDREGARVSSRLGLSVEAIQVSADLDLLLLATRFVAAHGGIDYVVCDECQFYTPAQAEQLAEICDLFDTDVYAFGLITDFRARLFPGTQRLLELADERIQLSVEARCWCGGRATTNARAVNGAVVYEGDVVVVGDTVAHDTPLFGDVITYELLCRRHYRSGEICAPETAAR